tara:strand:+ start:27894 stop:28871 length:978 start_codon:yes stop_codon:yes gene_type:complete
MSRLVTDIKYQEAFRTIRELIQDVNPVQAFKVIGQGFSFVKNSQGFIINGNLYTFAQAPKFYDLSKILRSEGLDVRVMPSFVASEFTNTLDDVIYPSDYTPPTFDENGDLLTEGAMPEVPEPEEGAEPVEPVDGELILTRENYFSTPVIEKLMEDFCFDYLDFLGIPRTLSTIFGGLEYYTKRKMIYWVAYYLIDRKRMNFASAQEMMRLNGDDECNSSGELINKNEEITTKIGDSFTVRESINEEGKGVEGFTSLWGDQYSYLTKLQLWIRHRFEKQFKDFSLRDDCLITQSFFLEKGWEPSAYFDTINYSIYTEDLMLPNDNL